MNSTPKDHLHLETTLKPDLSLSSKNMSLSSVSMAMGHLATSHGKKLGIYRGFDASRDCGWVVLSTKLRILQSIPTDRPVKVETWVASIESGKLIREYRVSENDRTLAEAAHAFVLFDRSSRRIVIPPREARERLRGRNPTYRFNIDLSRRTERPIFSATDEIADRIVTISDIDQNHHLNNSVYLRWMEAHIEQNGFTTDNSRQFRPFEFGIEFLAEVGVGEKVQLRSQKIDKNSELTTYFLPSDPARNLLAISRVALLS
ncbi:MAG: thioesterase [Bdellovibrionales bacterium]|nr:thioesterase [Bdellovibrionales bacterium]